VNSGAHEQIALAAPHGADDLVKCYLAKVVQHQSEYIL
jgi:hypothetical protein